MRFFSFLHRTRKCPTCSNVKPPNQDYMRINIRTLTGRNMRFIVRQDCPVEILAQIIQCAEGVPADQMRFIFAGKQLEWQRTLANYEVRDGSTVHLVLKLRGD